jgi:hypothetical protein
LTLKKNTCRIANILGPVTIFDYAEGMFVQNSKLIKLEHYRPFVGRLKHLAQSESQIEEAAIEDVLNGEAYTALRELVPLEERRNSGIFFTGTECASALLGLLNSDEALPSKVLDPACGAGNLLIAFAERLPIAETLDRTLRIWGDALYGFDISNDFVSATKLRLALLARQRGCFLEPIGDLDTIFPNILCVNALEVRKLFKEVNLILLNPPYQGISAPDSCAWAKGKVSSAAIFVDHIIRHMGNGTRLLSILPEVLRCGSRYQKFRNEAGRYVQSTNVKSLGTFDSWTDIDVFISDLKLNETLTAKDRVPVFQISQPKTSVVGDRFNVHVGPLVEYRSPKKGALRPYLEAKGTPAWSKAHVCENARRFSGTVFKPPFVVIRRTSRPGDTFRAIGTIVKGNEEVAVENHLIIVQPKKLTLAECHTLLKVLRNSKTNKFLNETMRCRHLTVQSVINIPWSENE